MTELLEEAFRAADRLPPYEQQELAERILYEVHQAAPDLETPRVAESQYRVE